MARNNASGPSGADADPSAHAQDGLPARTRSIQRMLGAEESTIICGASFRLGGPQSNPDVYIDQDEGFISSYSGAHHVLGYFPIPRTYIDIIGFVVFTYWTGQTFQLRYFKSVSWTGVSVLIAPPNSSTGAAGEIEPTLNHRPYPLVRRLRSYDNVWITAQLRPGQRIFGAAAFYN